MIDFRYHIVSLISVFLALAVGIVLGAGPLRDYIAESLSGQVEQLREETETLRGELQHTQESLGHANEFIDGTAEALTTGVLPAYPVSIVLMPGVDGDTVNALGDTLSAAGSSVLNIVEITEDFTDPAKRPFRSGIAGNLATYMDPAPVEDASAEAVIGHGLEQALSSYDPANPQEPSEDAAAIIDLLRTSELIVVDGEVLPTLLTVVVTSDVAAQEETLAAGLGLIKGMSPARTLVAGTDADDTLLRIVRTDSEAADAFASTDSLTTTPGMIIVPRALAALVAGQVGTYGFAAAAQSPFPPVVDISAPEPIEPVEGEDEATDGTEGSAEEGDPGAGPEDEE